MPKQTFTDMIPRKRLPPLPEKRLQPSPRAEEPEEREEAPIERKRTAPRAADPAAHTFGKPKRKWPKILIAVLVLLGAAFGVLSFFTGADVLVSAKEQTSKVSLAVSSQKSIGDVPYQVMTLADEGSVTVPATSEQDVENKAMGTIVIYNNFTADSYRLIKNTRFQTPGKLIFKIADSVVVPGKTMKNGTSTPGSVEAEVYAESAGPEYNVGYSDFTIPGFAGKPQFTGFYARSKTEIAGGFIGKEKVASDDAIAAARAKLDSDLKAHVTDSAAAKVPDGFALFRDVGTVAFSSDAPKQSDGGVTVTEHATFSAPLFPRAALVKLIAAKAGLPDGSYAVTNLETLLISSSTITPVALSNGTPISFVISGDADIRYVIDTEKLRTDLASTARADLQKVLTNYPGVDRMELKLRPFWKTSFPSDPDKIKLTVK